MRQILQQLKQYKRDTFLCIGLTTLEVVMEILLPFITAMLIDQGLEASNMPIVYRYGILMVVMAFLSLAFGALAGKFAASASTGLAANLREAIYANIQTFSFSNIDKFSVPSLVTRMTTDITNVQNYDGDSCGNPCSAHAGFQLHYVSDHQPASERNVFDCSSLPGDCTGDYYDSDAGNL